MAESSEENNLSQATKLSVIKNGDELLSVWFELVDENGSSIEDIENTGQVDESPDEEKKSENFQRKSCSPEELSDELRRLSNQWTTLSLAFFNIIPELTATNFDYAEDEIKKNVADYAAEVSESIEETELENGEILREYIIPEKNLGVLLKRFGKTSNAVQAAALMSQATLGALLSEYELFVTNMLRAIARYRPSTFINDDHKISVKKLEEYGSFDDFLKDSIDDSIAATTQEKSHYKMLKWIEDEFAINVTSDKLFVAEFVEICQRRHLIAHAGGRVNKKYLEICKEAGVPEDSLPELGSTLTVGKKYIRRATARIYQMGLFTLHILWHKLLPREIDKSHGSLLVASHDFLDSDLTKMARRVIEFALFTEKRMADAHKASLIINSALSYLHDPLLQDEERKKAVEKELRRKDWSIVSPLYELALSCVRQEFSNLDELTSAAMAAKKDNLDFTGAMTWVVFREARQKPEFVKHFE